MKTRIFVGIGDEVPTTTYDDMLSYLRYFASRHASPSCGASRPAARGAAWAAFYRETDPSPSTPENEALQNYLMLLRQTNATFQEATTPGWRTDRGMVWLLLGPPDQVIDPFGTDADAAGPLVALGVPEPEPQRRIRTDRHAAAMATDACVRS